MNILVTGGCGFIGSNFLNIMVKKYPEFNFINLDILYYCARIENIKVSEFKNYKFIKGDINDYNLIVYLIKSLFIDTIIHFAAQSHVDNSFLDSFKYTEDNVKGTHTLLEAIKNTNKNIKFIHISTDEVYGESELEENPKNEIDILCPTNPYAASKAAAEMYVNSYMHSFNLKCIITRGNNVYGPNQYPEKLIPKFIELLKKNKKCTIHGNGESLRSFIHVDDVVNAIDHILNFGKIGEIYNIGSEKGNELTVLEVAEKIVKIIKNDTNYVKYLTFIDDRPFNDKRYFISNKKLKDLGWSQKINFNDGLEKLINQYNL